MRDKTVGRRAKLAACDSLARFESFSLRWRWTKTVVLDSRLLPVAYTDQSPSFKLSTSGSSTRGTPPTAVIPR